MNIPRSTRSNPRAIKALLAHERNLLDEIHVYIKEHRELPRHSKQGLRKLESILLDDIEDLEQKRLLLLS